MKWVKELIAFIKAVANDPRIPDRDKAVVLALTALIISPVDIIPDWIPILGVVDDLILVAIVLDYFFNRLDQAILLSHYPWGMKSYSRIRRVARFIALLTPQFVRSFLWKYEPPKY